MSEKTIYDLKLHEELKINNNLYAIRVPGGWLYQYYSNSCIVVSVFVPYDNEFQEKNYIHEQTEF